MLTSGWAAPYFSLGSARVARLIVVLPNPSGASALLSFQISLRIRESLGDCEHVRDVVLARASMSYVVPAFSV